MERRVTSRIRLEELIEERNITPLLELSEDDLKTLLDHESTCLFKAVEADFLPMIELYQKYDTNWAWNIKNVFDALNRPELGQKMFEFCPEEQKEEVCLRLYNYPVNYLQCSEEATEFLSKNMKLEYRENNKRSAYHGDCIIPIELFTSSKDIRPS